MPRQGRVTQAGRRITQAIQPTDELIISLRSDLQVEVNSMPLPLAELGATLRELLAPRADRTVFIEAPGPLRYGAVVQVIDAVKTAGATPIRLRISEVQTSANGHADASRRASDNNHGAGGQRVTLSEQGISFVQPVGWRRDESAEANEGEFAWHGPDRTMLRVQVAFARPEDTSGSIEEETDRFYRDHKEGGSEDVRLLEIDGVRGVHFLVDDEWPYGGYEMERSRFIRWSGQRMYRGRRQIIFAVLSSPVRSFSRHRATLYGILNSIRFIRE
jgi:Biopolymer transport protein ExbD/TolR